MSKGPFIKDDLTESRGCEVVDGHITIPRARRPEGAEGAETFPSSARAGEALRAVGCEPEAEILVSASTGCLGYYSHDYARELADVLVRGLKRITRKRRGPWVAALTACRALRREIVEMYTPPPWDIRRKGRKWPQWEWHLRWESLGEGDIEVVGGKLFDDHRARMAVLAMVLENVGIDAAVRLGDLALWKKAIEAAIGAKRAKAAAARKRVRPKR